MSLRIIFYNIEDSKLFKIYYLAKNFYEFVKIDGVIVPKESFKYNEKENETHAYEVVCVLKFVYNNWDFMIKKNEYNILLEIPENEDLENDKLHNQLIWCMIQFFQFNDIIKISNTTWVITTNEALLEIQNLFNLPEIKI